MGIFNLGTMDKSKDVVSENKETNDVKDNNESVVADTAVPDTTATATDTPAEKKEVKIVLSGPLSEIYTQALNAVYSKEDTSLMLAPPMITIKTAENKDKITDADLYVYCCDGDNINLPEDTDNIKDATNNNNSIVAIECGSNINNKIGLLESFATTLGAKVCFSRKVAIEAIRMALVRL